MVMWLLDNLKLIPVKLPLLGLLQLLSKVLQLTRVLPDGLSLPSPNDNVLSVDGLTDESINGDISTVIVLTLYPTN